MMKKNPDSYLNIYHIRKKNYINIQINKIQVGRTLVTSIKITNCYVLKIGGQ